MRILTKPSTARCNLDMYTSYLLSEPVYTWNIERFHRAVKQTCNIERFQVRNQRAIMNHIFCAINAFVRLELLRAKQFIDNWYQIKRDLFVDVIKKFISQGGRNYSARTA